MLKKKEKKGLKKLASKARLSASRPFEILAGHTLVCGTSHAWRAGTNIVMILWQQRQHQRMVALEGGAASLPVTGGRASTPLGHRTLTPPLQVGRTFSFSSRSNSMTSQRSSTLPGGAAADAADAYSESGSVTSSAAATPRASSGAPYDPYSSATVRAVLAASASRAPDAPTLSAAQAQLAVLREERERLAAQNAQMEAALAATRADLEAAQATARDLHSRATVAEESKSVASQVGAGCRAPHSSAWPLTTSKRVVARKECWCDTAWICVSTCLAPPCLPIADAAQLDAEGGGA